MTTDTRLFAFLIAIAAVRLDAQMQGSFTPAGDLTTDRQGHTATLLINGKVLIAGGSATLAGSPVWASAELFDPVGTTFTATGSMVTPRVAHTATLLPDGRVLIAGGVPGDAPFIGGGYPLPLSSAELYDPAAGTFRVTGSMSTPRESHTATLLNNGKVLITGGIGASSAELYDPSTGIFTPAGYMNYARQGHLAVLLPNGKVLIEGDGSCSVAQQPELYDPVSGSFTLTGASTHPYLFPMTATLLLDGTVLTTMNVPCDDGNGAEIYDPATGTFTSSTSLPYDSVGFIANLLPNGQVFLHGSYEGADVYQAGGTFLLYDPHSGRYSMAPGSFPQSDQHGTSTLLSNGAVLMAGGWICCGFSVADAELYLPANDTPAPVLYALSGSTEGAILHGASQQLVSSSNPAVAGEAIEIYGAGLVEGGAIPPQVFIGGKMAQVLFFGDAPGYTGLNQINVVVPIGLASGTNATVEMLYLSRPSNSVAVAIQ